jgi:hypothetical protein
MDAEAEKMTKSKLMRLIREERGLLEMTLARLTHSQMFLSGVDGEWSVKDVLAHISAWERLMIKWTGSCQRNEKPETPEPWDVDKINAGIYAEIKDKPLSEVLEEFRRSYWDALVHVEDLTEGQLQKIYPDHWPMGALWIGVASNMNWHYKDHRRDIQKWLSGYKKER